MTFLHRPRLDPRHWSGRIGRPRGLGTVPPGLRPVNWARSEAEALAWIRRYLDDEGPEYVAELALDGPGADGQRQLIAEGPALVELALTVAPAAIN